MQKNIVNIKRISILIIIIFSICIGIGLISEKIKADELYFIQGQVRRGWGWGMPEGTEIVFSSPDGNETAIVGDNGNYIMYWNGKEESGALSSSGAYLLVLQAGDVLESQKVLLIR